MDWRGEVGTALPDAIFNWPDVWAADNLPLTICRTANDIPQAFADDVEDATSVEIFVDYYTADADDMFTAAALIDAALTAKDWTRTFSADLFESETRLHHRTMRYKKIF